MKTVEFEALQVFAPAIDSWNFDELTDKQDAQLESFIDTLQRRSIVPGVYTFGDTDPASRCDITGEVGPTIQVRYHY